MNSPHTIDAEEAITQAASRARAPTPAHPDAIALQQALDLLCALTPHVQCGLILAQLGKVRSLIVAASWPRRIAATRELEAAATTAWTHKRAVVVRAGGSTRRVVLALPIAIANGVTGVAAIAFSPSDAASDDDIVQTGRRAVQWITLLTRAGDPEGLSRASFVIEVLAKVIAQPAASVAARTLASEVAARLACDRVSFGWMRDGRLRLACMVPAVSADRRMPLARAVMGAMHEALDQRASVAHPPATRDRHIGMAHAQLARDGGLRRVLSIPFGAGGRPLGVLTLERGADVFDADSALTVSTLLALAGPVLAMKERLSAPLLTRMRRTLQEILAPQARRTWPLRAAWGFGIITGLGLLAMPVDYRVSADARIEGAIERTLSAPTDGFIRKVHALPGDRVRAGELIVSLDEEDAALEVRRAEGELAQADNAYSNAVAKQDLGQLAIHHAKREAAAAQLALARANHSRLRVVAPFDGTLTDGDLSRSIGAPVKRGDVLIKMSPGTDYRVTLKVDERDVGALAVDAKGGLTLASRAADVLPVAVARITPVSSALDGRNLFEVEARLLQPATGLRPGLEGVARIDAGRRSLGWVMAHRVLDWVRLRLWSLWG